MVAELLEQGYQVTALARVRSDVSELEAARVPVRYGDVTDLSSMCTVIKNSEPDVIFHLAAQSYVPASWDEPAATMRANAMGTLNILEAVKQHAPEAVLQVCGSSEEYGMVYPHETPITEEQPLRPLSPYGVSKVAADQLGYQYAKSYGLKLFRTRAFNHTGVGRGRQFVTTQIAKQAAEIKLGMRTSFTLGNIDAVRDFSHVCDVVRAYRLIAEAIYMARIEPGRVYNICSGVGHSIKQVVEIAAAIAGVYPQIQIDPERARPSDVPLLVGSDDLIRETVDWQPELGVHGAMAEMINWQKELIAPEI
jgi:GDP-4-dehydro-6-deoxy-D-mannose reductase